MKVFRQHLLDFLDATQSIAGRSLHAGDVPVWMAIEENRVRAAIEGATASARMELDGIDNAAGDRWTIGVSHGALRNVLRVIPDLLVELIAADRVLVVVHRHGRLSIPLLPNDDPSPLLTAAVRESRDVFQWTTTGRSFLRAMEAAATVVDRDTPIAAQRGVHLQLLNHAELVAFGVSSLGFGVVALDDTFYTNLRLPANLFTEVQSALRDSPAYSLLTVPIETIDMISRSFSDADEVAGWSYDPNTGTLTVTSDWMEITTATLPVGFPAHLIERVEAAYTDRGWSCTVEKAALSLAIRQVLSVAHQHDGVALTFDQHGEALVVQLAESRSLDTVVVLDGVEYESYGSPDDSVVYLSGKLLTQYLGAFDYPAVTLYVEASARPVRIRQGIQTVYQPPMFLQGEPT